MDVLEDYARPGDLTCVSDVCENAGRPVPANVCPLCGSATTTVPPESTDLSATAPLIAGQLRTEHGASGTGLSPSRFGSAATPNIVPPGGTPGQPADLGARFLARLIDLGVVLVPLFCGGLLLNFFEQGSGTQAESNPALVFIALVSYAPVILYEFVMLGHSGQTLGKKAMKVKVVRLSGEPLGWGAAALRVYVQMFASACSCGLAGLFFALSPLFDNSSWKRGWPDQIASSVVIRAE